MAIEDKILRADLTSMTAKVFSECTILDIYIDRHIGVRLGTSEMEENSTIEKKTSETKFSKKKRTNYKWYYIHRSEKIETFEPNTYREAVEISEKVL